MEEYEEYHYLVQRVKDMLWAMDTILQEYGGNLKKTTAMEYSALRVKILTSIALKTLASDLEQELRTINYSVTQKLF